MYIVIWAVERRVQGDQVKSAVCAFQGHVPEQLGYVLVGHLPGRDSGGRSFYGFFLAVPVEVKKHSRVGFDIIFIPEAQCEVQVRLHGHIASGKDNIGRPLVPA